jgi:8-oxo-dGTP pyrophosphatase MutT (NUDIX family)
MYAVVPSVLAYLEKDDRLLLGLREDLLPRPYRNQWGFSGGRLMPGEEAAISF